MDMDDRRPRGLAANTGFDNLRRCDGDMGGCFFLGTDPVGATVMMSLSITNPLIKFKSLFEKS